MGPLIVVDEYTRFAWILFSHTKITSLFKAHINFLNRPIQLRGRTAADRQRRRMPKLSSDVDSKSPCASSTTRSIINELLLQMTTSPCALAPESMSFFTNFSLPFSNWSSTLELIKNGLPTTADHPRLQSRARTPIRNLHLALTSTPAPTLQSGH
ncbi:hypothetical protein VTN31DRAFT_912 [Thermomyces dupontii]|uniref:uncharacterized protein n=1 Tax=Talaromyces thermophilus TaxID=28565 RepID=UPI0037425A5C